MFVYVSVSVCTCECSYSQWPEEGNTFSGVTSSYELLDWVSGTMLSLEEQQVFSNAEPSLQLLFFVLL